MRRVLLLILTMLWVPACTTITIVESPWKASPQWSADQHRLMAERLSAWLRSAEPLASLNEAAARAAIPGVVIVGESHDSSALAHAMVRAVLARAPAEVWEEGIIWRTRPGEERLQGLYSRTWRGSEARGHRVIAGGDRLNKVFAELCRSGLPANLILYSGNAHAVHNPDIDGPEPRTGGPLPAMSAAECGVPVTAYAVYPQENLLGYVDLNMAVSLIAAVNAGALTAEQGAAEAAWCEEELQRAKVELQVRGDLLIEVGPGRYIVSAGRGSSPWSMRTVAALRHLLERPGVVDAVSRGADIELVQRAAARGGPGAAYEEFVFRITPEPPQRPTIINISPRGRSRALSVAPRTTRSVVALPFRTSRSKRC